MKWLSRLFKTPHRRIRLRRALCDTLQYSIELTHQIETLQIEAEEIKHQITNLQQAIRDADLAWVAQGVDTGVSAG